MPSTGSVEMFGGRKVPKADASAKPPPSRSRSGWPGEAWHDAQSPAANTNLPRAGSPACSREASASFENAGVGFVISHATTPPTVPSPARTETTSKTIDQRRTLTGPHFDAAHSIGTHSLSSVIPLTNCRGSGLGLTDGIRDPRATLAHWLPATRRTVRLGLVLDFRVEFGPEQHHDGRHPHPDHQTDGCAKRSIGGVVIRVIRKIKRQQRGASEPGYRCEHAADADPAPLRRGAARSEAVQQSEPQQHQDDQGGPAPDPQQGVGE